LGYIHTKAKHSAVRKRAVQRFVTAESLLRVGGELKKAQGRNQIPSHLSYKQKIKIRTNKQVERDMGLVVPRGNGWQWTVGERVD